MVDSGRKRLSAASAIALALSLSLAATPVSAQMGSDGCLLLTGSQACRGFQTSYIAPYDALARQFSFLGNVWDVPSFDAAVFKYLNSTYGSSKLGSQLDCSSAAQKSTVFRWERTALCSRWVNHADSLLCKNENEGTSVANQQIACAETCEQFGRSQQNILSNSTLCPNGLTNDAQQVLAADLKFCQGGNASTTTTPTPNGACVKGSDNEDACGWGNSTMQLCAYCDGNKDACCGTFDLKAVCGIESSAKPGGTDSSSGSGNSGSGSSSKKLGGGAIAGIVIGVLAGLLILGLLLWFFCFRNKRTKKDRQMLMSPHEKPGAVAGAAPGGRNSENFATPMSTPPIASDYASNTGNGPLGSGVGTGAAPVTGTGASHAGTGSGTGAGVAAGAGAAAAGAAALAHHNRSSSPTVATQDGSRAAPAGANSPVASNLRNNAVSPTASGSAAPGAAPSSGHHTGVGAGAAAAGAAAVGGAALAHHNKKLPESPNSTRTSPSTVRNVPSTGAAPSSPVGSSHHAGPGALGAAAAIPAAAGAAGAYSRPSGPRAANDPFRDTSPSIPPGAAAAAPGGSFPTPHATGNATNPPAPVLGYAPNAPPPVSNYSANAPASSGSSPTGAGGVPVGTIFNHNAVSSGSPSSYNSGAFNQGPAHPAPTGSNHGPGLATGAALAAGAAGAVGLAHHNNHQGPSSPQGTTVPPGAIPSTAGQIEPTPPGVRTLPRVADNNKPGSFISTGARVAIVHEYNASLPDELTLRPGMQLEVLELFDDGWGRAKVLAGDASQAGRVGQFPTVCATSA